MKRIYLDYAAATPVDSRVQARMEPFLNLQYANPSAIEASRSRVAEFLSVHPDELIFTGSATESANLALIGAVRGWQVAHPDRVPHVIVSMIEHDAVLECARMLEKEGVQVSRVPVDTEGIVDLSALNSLITLDTVVIAIMYANNEIGTIEPISDIAKQIRKWKKEERNVVRSVRTTLDARYPLFYCDASQASNYLSLNLPLLGVDLLTLSGGKMYGPKGVGLLYVSRGLPLLPIMLGGGQERGLRAGTENVPAIIGFEAALKYAIESLQDESLRLSQIRDKTINMLRERFKDIIINGSMETRLPNNIHFSFPKVDHEFLAIALDARGFAVATKSACSETDAETSHVLLALLKDSADTRPISGIRVSLGRQTQMNDMEEFCDALHDIMKTLIVVFE